MPRGLKLLLVVAGVALVAGCSASTTPQVTFYSHGKAVAVKAARYCDPTGTQCTPPSKDPIALLPVPSSSPLQISVPAQVYSAPWQVAFLYLGKNGKQLAGRTSVFPPNQQHAYTLRLPLDGARFEHIEVEVFSAVLTPSAQGGVNFNIGGSWLLDAR